MAPRHPLSLLPLLTPCRQRRMDPITHTLVGASVARAVPAGRTPLAMAACVIGANLPDVDVASFVAGGAFPFAFRRGWTHGALAVVVLPFALTGLLLAWDRVVRRRRDPAAPPAVARRLLPLAAIAVLTHPLLDLLNVYGIRLLMPFDDTWFYGDVLFIADPWLWAVLGLGLWLGRRADTGGRTDGHRGRRPVQVALALAVAYIVLMAASAAGARYVVRRAMPFARAGVERLMVGPDPVTPFRKWVVIDEGGGYRVGEFDWLRTPKIRYEDLVYLPAGGDGPAAAAARQAAEGRWFLSWARFPFFRAEGDAADTTRRVHIIDARYALEASARFGALTVEVAAP